MFYAQCLTSALNSERWQPPLVSLAHNISSTGPPPVAETTQNKTYQAISISDNVNIADILHRTLESARATEHETGFTGHVATSLIMFDPVHLSKSHEGTLAPHFNILDVHFFLFC